MDITFEGKFFVNDSFENCCVGVEDGKIINIKKILKSENHQIFRNNVILPAGIDLHVHFREPGMTDKEDFSTGSKSAAFGFGATDKTPPLSDLCIPLPAATR